MPRVIHTPSAHEEEITRLEQQVRGQDVQIADLRKSRDRANDEADKWRGKLDELMALKAPLKPRPLLLPSRLCGKNPALTAERHRRTSAMRPRFFPSTDEEEYGASWLPGSGSVRDGAERGT